MKQFFIVYREGGQQPPNFKHESKVFACQEAERLAEKHPGSKFYVLRAESVCVKNNVTWEILE